MALPRMVGKYRIDGLLGRGAVGVVYKAFQEDLGRHVALKVLIAGQHGSPERIKRFLREARAAASLSHPGIVQVFDVGADKDLNFIVMEFVEGKSLADALKARRPKPEEALGIALRLAGALSAAHARGVVHRDIKPSNILLDASGQPKIADFGLATGLEEQERLTATGDILGTAWYMSPEQAFGSPEEIDARTDLYSLGAVLYEMLTGRPPFDGARATAVLKRIETEEVVPPSRVIPTLDPRLDGLVLKALEKDPSKRYFTAADFESAIWETLGFEQGLIAAHPPARRRFRTAALVLAGAVLVAGLSAVLPHHPAPLPPKVAAELAPSGGERDYLRSKELLEAGAVRRALEAATSAIDKGYDTAASRVHRAYVTFLRYQLIHGSTELTILHPQSALGLEQELELLRAKNASPDELLTVELAILSFKGSHRDVIARTTRETRGPLAVLRWTSLIRDAWATEDENGQAPRLNSAREELQEALAREPHHPYARFLWMLMRPPEEDKKPSRLTGAFLDAGPEGWSDSLILRSILRERQNRGDLLLENLELARRCDPRDSLAICYDLCTRLAVTEDARKEPAGFAKETRDALEPVLASQPPFPAPYFLVAVAHLIEGNIDRAEELLGHMRLKFGSPESWRSPQEWGRVESLADLARYSGEKGPRLLMAEARLLSYFKLPAAETLWSRVQELVSTPDAAQRYLLDKNELRELNVSIHRDRAAASAVRGKLDDVVTHLRECVRGGGDLEEILEDPRFDAVRNHGRIKEIQAKRE